MSFDQPGGRDWRARVGGGGPVRPAPRDTRGRSERGPLRTTGRVTSEVEAPWLARAGGTGAVRGVAVLVLLGVLLGSGAVGAVLGALVVLLLPFVLVFVVLAWFVGRVPGLPFLGGALLAGGLRAGARSGGGRAGPVPGRQVTLVHADGSSGELLVASSRRLPAGTLLRVWGPAVLGRRHVWAARFPGGMLVARGVVSAGVLAVLASCALLALAIGSL